MWNQRTLNFVFFKNCKVQNEKLQSALVKQALDTYLYRYHSYKNQQHEYLFIFMFYVQPSINVGNVDLRDLFGFSF